jgi:hypothetical protein
MLVQIQATHQSASMHRSHEDHLMTNSVKPGQALASVHRKKKPTNAPLEGAHQGGILGLLQGWQAT